MAVATTMRRGADNRCHHAWMNIYLNSSTGIAAGSVLTLAGDLLVTVKHELPRIGWKVRVTGRPARGGRLHVHKNAPVKDAPSDAEESVTEPPEVTG